MSHSTNIVININQSETIIEMNCYTRRISERYGVLVGNPKYFQNADAVEVLEFLNDNWEEYGMGNHYGAMLPIILQMVNYHCDMVMSYRKPDDTSPIEQYVHVQISHFD